MKKTAASEGVDLRVTHVHAQDEVHIDMKEQGASCITAVTATAGTASTATTTTTKHGPSSKFVDETVAGAANQDTEHLVTAEPPSLAGNAAHAGAQYSTDTADDLTVPREGVDAATYAWRRQR